MMQTLASGQNPVKALMGSARNMVAGVLLLIPGVVTDAIAVVLLLIPVQQVRTTANGNDQYKPPFHQAANEDVIEGEFTHIREDLENKP
jgi:UPF0716 protein FxsA